MGHQPTCGRAKRERGAVGGNRSVPPCRRARRTSNPSSNRPPRSPGSHGACGGRRRQRRLTRSSRAGHKDIPTRQRATTAAMASASMPDSAQCWSKPTKSGRMQPKSGRTQLNFGRNHPRVRRAQPKLIDLATVVVEPDKKVGRFQIVSPYLVRKLLLHSARIPSLWRATFVVERAPISFGERRPKLDPNQPMLVELRQSLVNFGPNRAKCGPIGQCWPKLGR